MLSSKDVTILVQSCDMYEDAWEPFFKLWNMFWADCPYKIILCTEQKQYECDFMDVETINTGNGLSWSARLRYALDRIDSKYVLFSIDDFFLTEKVDVEIFQKALELMESDEEIGLITFNRKKNNMVFPDKNDISNCFKPVGRKGYRTNVLISLFRKEYFLDLLYGDEDPWTYEWESNIRSLFAGYKIYTQDYRYTKPAFHYYMSPVDGMGITQRKWLKGNKTFFESHGIYNVNYDNLGFFTEEVTYDSILELSWQNRAERKRERKESIKNMGFKDKVTETLYDVKKSIIKSKFYKKLKYWKKCIHYWSYYKKLRNSRH